MHSSAPSYNARNCSERKERGKDPNGQLLSKTLNLKIATNMIIKCIHLI